MNYRKIILFTYFLLHSNSQQYLHTKKSIVSIWIKNIIIYICWKCCFWAQSSSVNSNLPSFVPVQYMYSVHLRRVQNAAKSCVQFTSLTFALAALAFECGEHFSVPCLFLLPDRLLRQRLPVQRRGDLDKAGVYIKKKIPHPLFIEWYFKFSPYK